MITELVAFQWIGAVMDMSIVSIKPMKQNALNAPMIQFTVAQIVV